MEINGVEISEMDIRTKMNEFFHELTSPARVEWRQADMSKLVLFAKKTGPLQDYLGLKESDIDPIQEWCAKNDCGTRISFEAFKFKNKEQMTMFMLRWAT